MTSESRFIKSKILNGSDEQKFQRWARSSLNQGTLVLTCNNLLIILIANTIILPFI